MKTIVLKCRPNAQFHFGRITLGEDATNLDDTSDYLHSDTLFSAVINTAVMLYNENEVIDLIKDFKNENLTISSAFYCLKVGGEWIYFLPKPVTCNLLQTPKENHKKYKKVAFISQKVWKMGTFPTNWETECIFIQDRFLIHKSELATYKKEELEKLRIFSRISLPKVKVTAQDPLNRLYSQTNISLADNEPLNSQDRKIKPNVHFYFLTKAKDYQADYYKKLKLILEVLADTGIGGERSVGCGKLEGIEIIENQFEDMEVENTQFATLSLVIPDRTEFGSFQYYDLITRGGRATGNKLDENSLERLKKVKMLKEGAVLKSEIAGKVEEIKPETNPNPFLRNGLCFTLPLHNNYFQKNEKAHQ